MRFVPNERDVNDFVWCIVSLLLTIGIMCMCYAPSMPAWLDKLTRILSPIVLILGAYIILRMPREVKVK